MSDRTRTWRFPGDRLYHRDHLWIKEDGDSVVLGVSDYLQDAAGAILFVQLPEPDTKIKKGDRIVSLEAAKWVGHITAPFDGRVEAVNDFLGRQPGLVNVDPYGAGWLLRLSAGEGAGEGTLTGEDYLVLVEELAGEDGMAES